MEKLPSREELLAKREEWLKKLNKRTLGLDPRAFNTDRLLRHERKGHTDS